MHASLVSKPWLAMVSVVGLLALVSLIGACKRRLAPGEQRPPIRELFPRLTCQAARAELDEVAAGRGTPRAIVLRPAALLVIDAKDVKGPAKLTCDGIVFAAVDAQQADPTGAIVLANGPHSVLVQELRNGTLQVSQYCIGCNVVRGEKENKR